MSKRIHDYEWIRRNIMAISFACGFSLALYGLSLEARELPDNANQERTAITIDVTNVKQSLNHKEVNQFIAAQQQKPVKYAANDNVHIILSNEPIVLADAEEASKLHPYTPGTFADLGWRFTRDMTMVQLPEFTVNANNARRVPIIPSVIFSTPAKPVIAAKQSSNITYSQQLTAAQSTIFTIILWLTFAVSALAVLSLLLTTRQRFSKNKRSLIYSGKLKRATDMAGHGAMFDFNKKTHTGTISTMNINHLSMLWHLGKLSDKNAINTYFYVTYFIPSQHGYAATLRKPVVKKETTE